MPEVQPYIRQIDSTIAEEARRYYHNHPDNISVIERLEKVTVTAAEDRFWNYLETKRYHITLISTYSPDYILINQEEEDKSIVEKTVHTARNNFCTALEATPKYRTLPTNILSRTTKYFTLPAFTDCSPPHHNSLFIDLTDLE
jgi:hypothetical protein